jgi:hypothetical protein
MRDFFSMKPLLIAACIAGFSVLPQVSLGQQACQVTVRARVEVASGEFSLADLLARDSCRELLRAAARLPLGSAPLAGSVRVFEASEVRVLLQKVTRSIRYSAGGSTSMHVPERVTVRRAGARASCADIGRRIRESLDARPVAAEAGRHGTARPIADRVAARVVASHDIAAHVIDCGVADRIPQGTPLELTRTVWAPALHSWEVSVRCVHPGDCVPFLMRVQDHNSAPEMGPSTQRITASSSPSGWPTGRAALNPSNAKPMVRPGEAVTLLWDEDGIRLVVPAICLDPGGAGQSVRARIAPGGRLVRAIVVRAGELRMSS